MYTSPYYYTPFVDPISSYVFVDPLYTQPYQILNPVTHIIPPYENLNTNSDIRNKIVNYFHKKIINKWLYSDMSNLLGFLKISNDKVVFIDKMQDYDKNNSDSSDNKRKKINFLVNFLLTKELVHKYLRKYVSSHNVQFINLRSKKDSVRKYLHKRLYNKFEKTIKSS
jgi:hypothetical protein